MVIQQQQHSLPFRRSALRLDQFGAQGGRLYLGFQSGNSGTYAITAASNTNQLLFQSSPDYVKFVDYQQVDQSWNDQWYKLSLTWTSDTFTARLYDTNGITLLNQLSTVLPVPMPPVSPFAVLAVQPLPRSTYLRFRNPVKRLPWR